MKYGFGMQTLLFVLDLMISVFSLPQFALLYDTVYLVALAIFLEVFGIFFTFHMINT